MLRFSISCFLALTAFAEPADLIVTARYVVTMDASRRIIDNGAVAVKGERLLAVGTRAEIDKRYQSKRRIDAGDAIITPGLINTHTHAAMSLLRGIADDLKLQDWLEKFIFPAESKNVSPEFVRWGTKLACVEMLLSGTTTFTDMYYFEADVAEATKECGMRAVLGQTVIGFPVPDAKTPEDALKRAEAFLIKYKNDPLIVPAIAPHAVYTTPDHILQAARKLANQHQAPLLIHVSETKKENDDLQVQRNTSPVQLLEKLGVLEGRTLAAHGIWVSDADIATLKSRNTGVAHCPSSNMKLASGAAPLLKYFAAGINVGLGPDGPAGSNNDFNMFEEMDLAAKLQKVITGDPTAVTAEQALAMATIQGAKALGLEKEIGSIEPGKRADFVVIDASTAHAKPLYNVYSQVVYALKGSDVRHVIVNGHVVVRDRQIVTLNTSQVFAKAEEFRKAVVASVEPELR